MVGAWLGGWACAAPDLDGLIVRLSAQLQGQESAAPCQRWPGARIGDAIKMFGIDDCLS